MANPVNVPYIGLRPIIPIYLKTPSGTFSPIRFLLDTGADSTNMGRQFLTQMGYTDAQIQALKVGTSTATGLGGSVDVDIVKLDVKVAQSEPPFTMNVALNPSIKTDEFNLFGRAFLLDKYTVSISNNYVVFTRKDTNQSVKVPPSATKKVITPPGMKGSVPQGQGQEPKLSLPGQAINIKIGNLIISDRQAVIGVTGFAMLFAVIIGMNS